MLKSEWDGVKMCHFHESVDHDKDAVKTLGKRKVCKKVQSDELPWTKRVW